ncbi:MAG: sirohydrochlorin cobaltochelatase [Clostridiales bacterium]|nr:sirohydrochlorin cobaltochelatase [Clostridiales bacterium]
MKAILLIGHGSRAKDAKDCFLKVLESLEKRVDLKVYGAFMENATPTIEETFKLMHKEGVNEVDVLPYFLFDGIHIKEDIPEILDNMKKEYNMKICFKRPIGYHELLVDLLIDRLEGEGKCI